MAEPTSRYAAVPDDGKGTRGGDLPPVGGSTRAAMAAVLPQLPYGNAVYEAFAGVGLRPEVMEVGLQTARTSGPEELFLRLVWPAGNLKLGKAARPDGLTVRWAHTSGWSAHTAVDSRQLPVGKLADPQVLADAGLYLAEHGVGGVWEPPDRSARWEHTMYLDLALVRSAGQGVIPW